MPYVKFVKTRRIEYVDVKVHEVKNAKSLAFLQGLFVFAPPVRTGLELIPYVRDMINPAHAGL
jgi:hypothetical protein